MPRRGRSRHYLSIISFVDCSAAFVIVSDSVLGEEGGFVFDDHKIPRAGRDREESHVSHPVVSCTGRQSAVDHPP